jgi:hypothetical protein
LVLGKERRKSKLAFTVAAVALFPLLALEAFIAFQNILRSTWRRPSVEWYAPLIGTVFAFGFTVFLVTTSGLWVARSFGYRLLSRKCEETRDSDVGD